MPVAEPVATVADAAEEEFRRASADLRAAIALAPPGSRQHAEMSEVLQALEAEMQVMAAERSPPPAPVPAAAAPPPHAAATTSPPGGSALRRQFEQMSQGGPPSQPRAAPPMGGGAAVYSPLRTQPQPQVQVGRQLRTDLNCPDLARTADR